MIPPFPVSPASAGLIFALREGEEKVRKTGTFLPGTDGEKY